ncbi:DUF4214 domain-containing protein [Halomonas saccharevitans]|uniref:DUF4214 domain-containing protein n=1 Tax=Halomonas saccharevitans TaxID=416872 RepID=A0ABU3NCV8_9GAMM|nr:DUF4214 domain-containing protein [Halomonas saccharevitans]MDT8878363.1 DUF4214 domain-containing protein [Halomonas saccharevitans]
MGTGDIRIDALLQDGYGLAANKAEGTALEITFHFMESVEPVEGQSPLTEPIVGFRAMDNAIRSAARDVLSHVSDQIGVTFKEVGSDTPVMLRIAMYNGASQGEEGVAGITMYQGPAGLEPIILLNHSLYPPGDAYGDFRDTFLHELGHALGLKHPGAYWDWESGPYLPEELDHTGNTVMSYHYQEPGYVETLQEFDLLALHHLYGRVSGEAPAHNRMQIDNPDVWTFGSAASDIITMDPGPRGEYAKSVITSWGDDHLILDSQRMAGGDGIVFQGGHGTDHLVLNHARHQAHDLDMGGVPETFNLETMAETRFTTLHDVERVHFTDSSVAFDVDGSAGQAYRLYKATFDRLPDEEGLGYWIHQMDNGMTLTEVAGSFAGSGEYVERYGADVSNDEFLDALYLNVLDRTPDQGGFEFWTVQMDEAGSTRSQVLASFSESSENQDNVAGLIGQGIVYDEWVA